MGRYCAWTDVAGRYPDAAKKGNDSNTGSYWLSHAEDLVDGYLSPKYTVPFSPVPGIVSDLAIDMTYYKMMILTEGAKNVWEFIEHRITGLLNGTILLTTSGSALGAGTAWSAAEGHHTSFGPDDPINWSISSNWAGDVETERELG